MAPKGLFDPEGGRSEVSERVYEILFIADPNLGEPEVDALAEQVQGFIEKEGARIQKVEKWGKKRLAYEVRRHREGYYVLLVAEGGNAAMVHEVERRIKVSDGIVRFLTVRVDDELRKAERRKARRAAEDEKRKARTGARAAAPAEEVQP
jgi:small subunit ribosomal protein S6